jgi:Phosphoinositide phospholipase C, Ca2+-dependent
MKRLGVLAIAILGAACSPPAKPVDAAAAKPAAECDLKAPSASVAETTKGGCGAKWIDANVRINQLQSVGTHNSYKMKIPDNELAYIAERNAKTAETLDYEHETIPAQLDKGARQLEIDPYDDPKGGVFSHPLIRKILTERGVKLANYDLSPLDKPGVKVLHANDIDYRSQCLLFIDCMKQIKAWSDAHPNHTPILVMVNPKNTTVSWPGAAPVLRFGKEGFDRLDAEIASVWPKERVITPDEVKGVHATLREAVTAGDGWPLLGKARGRVMFALDLSPEDTKPYVEGHPSLAGRMMFPTTFPASPEAAYFTMNEPLKEADLMKQRVSQGFLIRTRADADTQEARSGDITRREAAFATGAQFVSTDYQDPDVRFKTGYSVSLPGGGATRCNPVDAPKGCDSKAE